MIFRSGNMTPSDVMAGIILLSNKQTNQFNRESWIKRRDINIGNIPRWMNINEAAYYFKYAIATYSWPYYIYMNNIKGMCDLCCFSGSDNSCCCCCCFVSKCCSKDDSYITGIGDDDSSITNQPVSGEYNKPKLIINGDNRCNQHMRAFKYLSKAEECDILFANFHNELFLVPFCVLVDHFKKSVIITIRGTLSMRYFFYFVLLICLEYQNFLIIESTLNVENIFI